MAAFSATICGWLFLPVATYKIEGLPEYSKTTVTCLTVITFTALFDVNRILHFRPKLIDSFVLAYCLCPILSSLNNGLGLYDGLSASFAQHVVWMAPYLVGRLYIRNSDDAVLFLRCIVYGGFAYLPLCWLEMRLSPQLHNWVYGYSQHSFMQTVRGDGYRPMVFMQHGLSLALYMTSACIAGLALWTTGKLSRIFGLGLGPLVLVLFVNIPLLRSGNALVTTSLGALQLFVSKFGKSIALPLFLLSTSLPVLYVTDRLNHDLSSSALVSIAQSISVDRAQSLEFRIKQEQALIDKALQQPVFGWSGWGRARVFDEDGTDRSVTDSLWVITLGNNGLVGLLLLTGVLLAGPTWLAWSYRIADWHSPDVKCNVAIGVIVVMYAIDCCFNAMPNPVYVIACGGLSNIPFSGSRTGYGS